eukprot:m.160263 g.160263  ORF g.160263 m.160263 type:complete len:733 (-) comp23784_c0_seq5:112-2310(-)
MSAFTTLGMMPEITSAIEEMDWLLPTEIQHEAIPLILGGGDVLMAAETGSGKTGAFCLPVLQIVYESHYQRASAAEQSKKEPEGHGPCVMNPFDRQPDFAISEDGLLCQSRVERGWQGARTTLGVVKGKHYYEALMTDEGLCRCGWSTVGASHDLGTDKQGFGFGGTGKKSHARQFDTFGEPYGKNDVLGCCVDLDTNQISYTRNGVDLGVAFTIQKQLHGQAFYAATTLKNAELQFNFGDTPFKHPPTGVYAEFTGLAHAKPDERAVKAAASAASGKGRTPMAVIIEPSRELAEQTFAQIELFRKNLPSPGVQAVALIGGGDTKEQIRQLQAGTDIVVGTPGRISDFLSTGKLDVSQVRFYILDEADGLLTSGQSRMVHDLYARLPKTTVGGARLQMIVCSATLHHPEVKKMAEKLMQHPIWVDLKGQDAVPDTVHHVVCFVDPETDSRWRENAGRLGRTDGVHAHDVDKQAVGTSPENMSEAIKLLKYTYVKTAVDSLKMDQAIIFCRTKYDCDNLEAYLQTIGGGKGMVNEYKCVVLHGGKGPSRGESLQAFKNGEARFLICTDVAARGIDIRGVPYIINMTLPDEKENYIHRIGRVGRAERMGLAISLVGTHKEKVWYCFQGCPSKGKLPCSNTKLKNDGGCTIWYDEKQYLRDIEEHLGITVPLVRRDMTIPTCEFDGKVVYGEKKAAAGSGYQGHAEQLAPSVAELARLEFTAQTSYLRLRAATFK